MIGSDFIVVLLTLYAESKKTGVRFRIAELENGDDKALRSLEGGVLTIIVQGDSQAYLLCVSPSTMINIVPNLKTTHSVFHKE